MIRKHIATDGTIRDGAAPFDHQTRPMLSTKIRNLREARRAGARPEGQIKENVDIARRLEIHQMCNPTPGAPVDVEHFRPMPGRVLAQRRGRFEEAKKLLIVPDAADYWGHQMDCAFFDVLAVASDVHTVKVGDVVIAPAYTGQDVRKWLGPERFMLKAPEYRCLSGTSFSHGSSEAYHDTEAHNGACDCTGMVLCIVEVDNAQESSNS